LPREQQVEEIEGCTRWYREHIVGFTRPFTHKGGGGGAGARVDAAFTRELIGRQNFIYWGNGGQHPNEQGWPTLRGGETWIVPTGCLDVDAGGAAPVHAQITDPITSDYPGRFDYPVADGVAMWRANFVYHYNLPQRPILAVNAFHDWGLKSLVEGAGRGSNHDEGRILKEFLLDVLVKNKDKYPDTYCVTFHQVVEYAKSNGDLQHTLASGNGQDRRNPEKPLAE